MSLGIGLNSIDNDLYIEFNSLKDNKDWQTVYRLYRESIESLSSLIHIVSLKNSISTTQARDIVLFEMMSSYYQRGHREKLSNRNRLKWSLIYILAMCMIFLNGLISLLVPRKSIKRDVIFEEMFSVKGWSLRFYRYIVDIFKENKDISKSVVYTHPGLNKDFFDNTIEGWSGEVINRREKSILFGFKNSMFVFFNNILSVSKLYHLSQKLNLIYLYLRVIRKYLVYTSQAKGIKAKVLIAAGDYYWNPIKYIIYKKNISNIILLQHNFKNEYLHNRLFQYCDYYYAHSEQAIEKLEGIPFAQKYAIGSFQLVPFLEEEDKEYDILFINQTVNDDLQNAWPDLDQDKLIKSYDKLIDNFKVYLEKNGYLKAIYVAKGETINSEPSLSVKQKYKAVDNIEFTGAYGPKTFELIKKSSIIINMYSSVGFESYGLDKKVLWINYDRCCDIFKYDTETEDLHVMIDDSYEAFEERINLLLSDTQEVKEHYVRLKKKYMNINENPARVVADKILELVEKD